MDFTILETQGCTAPQVTGDSPRTLEVQTQASVSRGHPPSGPQGHLMKEPAHPVCLSPGTGGVPFQSTDVLSTNSYCARTRPRREFRGDGRQGVTTAGASCVTVAAAVNPRRRSRSQGQKSASRDRALTWLPRTLALRARSASLWLMSWVSFGNVGGIWHREGANRSP